MGNWDDGHMDDGWGLAMFFGMLSVGLLVAIAVGLAVLWAARSAKAPSPTPVEPPASSTMHRGIWQAEQILAERMARGEIDTEEYETRLEALQTGAPQ
jgi:putative membrane protein